MPREGNFHLHYHRLYAYQSNPNSETRLEARFVLVEPGMARRRSSSRIRRRRRRRWRPDRSGQWCHRLGKFPNWLDAARVCRLKRSIVRRCCVMSREKGGECRTARHGLQCCTARHELLKMMPHMNDVVALVRAWLSRSLRGNALPRRTADT